MIKEKAFLSLRYIVLKNYISRTIRNRMLQGNLYSFDFSIQAKHISQLNNSICRDNEILVSDVRVNKLTSSRSIFLDTCGWNHIT